MIEPQVDEVEAITGIEIKVVTADAGYAYAKAYGALERRGIDALIPAKAEPIKSRVPLRRFRYDAKNDILKCPRGRILRPARPSRAGRSLQHRSGLAVHRIGFYQRAGRRCGHGPYPRSRSASR